MLTIFLTVPSALLSARERNLPSCHMLQQFAITPEDLFSWLHTLLHSSLPGIPLLCLADLAGLFNAWRLLAFEAWAQQCLTHTSLSTQGAFHRSRSLPPNSEDALYPSGTRPKSLQLIEAATASNSSDTLTAFEHKN